MKKLFLLLGCIAAFSSCLKNDKWESDVVDNGVAIYVNVLMQNQLALDPFNIAFRLNSLIVEGNGDYTAASEKIKETLLGRDVKIAYDEISGIYTVTFDKSKTEFTRSGSVQIKTNGFATLGESMAQWQVNLPSVTPYTVADETESATINPGASYSIQNTGNNAWRVSMQTFVASLGNQDFDGTVVEMASKWTGYYLVEQLSGTQKYEDISKSVYSVATDIANSTMTSLPFDVDRLSVRSIDNPLKFNPGCSLWLPVGSGKMVIMFTEDDTFQNLTDVEVLGTDNKTCRPVTRVKYRGLSKEVQL